MAETETPPVLPHESPLGPAAPSSRRRRDPAERFWEKVSPEPMSGCFLWTGYLNAYGYGVLSLGRRGEGTMLAHRFAYVLLRGPLPQSKAADHLCKVRSCVNPSHLDLVPQGENWRRGDSPNAVAARIGFCRRGHPATPQHIHVRSNGYRYCRTCVNDRRRSKANV